jgi:hypothetical protein
VTGPSQTCLDSGARFWLSQLLLQLGFATWHSSGQWDVRGDVLGPSGREIAPWAKHSREESWLVSSPIASLPEASMWGCDVRIMQLSCDQEVSQDHCRDACPRRASSSPSFLLNEPISERLDHNAWYTGRWLLFSLSYCYVWRECVLAA